MSKQDQIVGMDIGDVAEEQLSPQVSWESV